jgi:hypothetical protein
VSTATPSSPNLTPPPHSNPQEEIRTLRAERSHGGTCALESLSSADLPSAEGRRRGGPQAPALQALLSAAESGSSRSASSPQFSGELSSPTGPLPFLEAQQKLQAGPDAKPRTLRESAQRGSNNALNLLVSMQQASAQSPTAVQPLPRLAGFLSEPTRQPSLEPVGENDVIIPCSR